MYWLLPPPYLRWLAAAAVFFVLAVIDLSGRATEPFPFAADPIPAGSPLGDAVEWRDVPHDMLPPPGDVAGFAARHIEAGEPITSSAVRESDGIPRGWWSVPVELPEQSAPGDEVRLISAEASLDVTGIVVTAGSSGAFATINPGLVAVPPDAAAAVASAASLGRLIVLLAA